MYPCYKGSFGIQVFPHHRYVETLAQNRRNFDSCSRKLFHNSQWGLVGGDISYFQESGNSNFYVLRDRGLDLHHPHFVVARGTTTVQLVSRTATNQPTNRNNNIGNRSPGTGICIRICILKEPCLPNCSIGEASHGGKTSINLSLGTKGRLRSYVYFGE